MSSPTPTREATALLQRLSSGDAGASEPLFRLLYGELRATAQRAMRGERADHTLQPTALVNEAFLKLVEPSGAPPEIEWESRAHFLGVAARAMRQVLVDHARKRRSDKRDSGRERLPLDADLVAFEASAIDLLALDEALAKLAAHDEELARLVELRFFGGLTVEETGKVLGLSVRQVEGAWITARAWLYRAVGGSAARDDA
jgi:RNA polymerase sigma-70 factor (ECF subfamily)